MQSKNNHIVDLKLVMVIAIGFFYAQQQNDFISVKNGVEMFDIL